MKVLIDTNIVIHRESSHVLNEDIGILFRWLDNLHYTKCLHQVTLEEINRLRSTQSRESFNVKLSSYNVLQTQSPLHPEVRKVGDAFDRNENDFNDTLLLNELYNDRVDVLITEDRRLREKAQILGVGDRVFTIDSFLEKVTAENPGLADYGVLSVKKELFGNIDVNEDFFDSYREDYPQFDKWFNSKSEEMAYVCRSHRRIQAFLYLKIEDEREPYPDISPPFTRKRRIKVGSFKVTMNGYKLGERFVKIIFDNAVRYRVDEIYITVFDRTIEQRRLQNLLEDFGFCLHGTKRNIYGEELVYVRSMKKSVDLDNPKLTYPYFSKNSRVFIVSIYQRYHTNLFPDSILRTESAEDFVENEPFRNAISKVYISRSHLRDLVSGDIILFYRTGGYYRGVLTTFGIVESVVTDISDSNHFIRLCRKRSVFSDQELLQYWDYWPNNRPFVVNFLYVYSFPKRLNLQRLIEIGVIQDVSSVPRGFEPLSMEMFDRILVETETDESVVVN